MALPAFPDYQANPLFLTKPALGVPATCDHCQLSDGESPKELIGPHLSRAAVGKPWQPKNLP